MKLVLVIIIFYSFNLTFAQEKINQFDVNGNRTGIWKKLYDNGNIRYQGQFEAGKEIGVFKFYSINNPNFPTLIKTYFKENDTATVEFFTEKEILQSKGSMIGKERVGKWIYFNADGKTILSEENYENGLLNGVSKTFYKNGNITEILHYKNGKLEGITQRFSNEGILLEEISFKNGMRNGLAKFFDTNGALIYSGMYENDEKVGKWEFYGNKKTEEVNQTKQ